MTSDDFLKNSTRVEIRIKITAILIKYDKKT